MPEYGVCKLSVACIWKNAVSDTSLLSQALFGEAVKIINIKNSRWVRVVCLWDDVVGWMDPKHLHFLDAKGFKKITDHKHYSLELIYGIISEKISIPITIGADLHSFDGINVKMPFGKFLYSGQAFSLTQSQINANLMIKLGQKFLNAPQMKGGRSILGMDASAFVQLLFKFLDVQLPRYAKDQVGFGDDVGFIGEAQIGDLAFFAKSNNEVHHVGIVIGENQIIHVHGRVKIDRLDQQGIYDLETRRYTYKLRTLRRIVEL